MWPPVGVISCVLFTCPQTCRTSWCVLAFLWVSSTHLLAGQGLCPHFLICSDFLLSLNPFLITQYKTVTDPHTTYFSFNFSMVNYHYKPNHVCWLVTTSIIKTQPPWRLGVHWFHSLLYPWQLEYCVMLIKYLLNQWKAGIRK